MLHMPCVCCFVLHHTGLQDDSEADEELLQAFLPHMQHLLGLALKYSQQASAAGQAAWSPPSTGRPLSRALPDGPQQQAARCSTLTASADNIRPAVALLTPFLAGVTDAAGAVEAAGQQALTADSSSWFDSASLQTSASAVFSPLREWQPLSPTRQGRYQRIFPRQASAAAQPGLRTVQSAWDVGAGVTAARAGGQQAQLGAGAAGAAWQQQSREVARLLLQALLVLVKEPRCVRVCVVFQLRSLCTWESPCLLAKGAFACLALCSKWLCDTPSPGKVTCLTIMRRLPAGCWPVGAGSPQSWQQSSRQSA